MEWKYKLWISIAVDVLDFTLGRALFVAPFSGEIIGSIVGYLLFGSKGLFYMLESLDVTEQIDGFIPMATLIASKARDD